MSSNCDSLNFGWAKQGLLFCPSGDGFFKTHAARPVPLQPGDGSLSLFFSSRDCNDSMLPSLLDVDISKSLAVEKVAELPLIDLGSPGCFDDSGVTIGSAVIQGDRALLYYTGWKRRRLVSFELSIGVLEWDLRTQQLRRISQGPIIGQDRNHHLLTAGPFVAYENGVFKMWYCSGTDWAFPHGNPEPIYTVFYAESSNGFDWIPHKNPVIPYAYEGEVVSAPWVVKASDRYCMWYSTRGHKTREEKNYSIGYAESNDGVHWERLDSMAGIGRSLSGWDSEMVCYPAVTTLHDKTYMFYSGNGVGRGGLGYAEASNAIKIMPW